MPLSIDHESSVPPYEQLRVQLLEQVRSGMLAAGAKLPTVRGLAEELGLAANTVARCYRELERDHVIETRGRNGSYISEYGDAAQREAQRAAHDYAEQTRQLGVSASDALALVEAALRS
ncbi:GntR family transcriptional regulator [Glaciihabitans sp. UYNi722]|uniref:GntR family transcriptional regulator n=1 Tax=Glaciihabitans sp. UYNi722 TaxID=3156344 RepID=UPI00339A13B8